VVPGLAVALAVCVQVPFVLTQGWIGVAAHDELRVAVAAPEL